MSRRVSVLKVPTGPAVVGIIERLMHALDGTGPVLLPVPADDERAATRLIEHLRPQDGLADTEDADTDPTALIVATSGSTGTPKGALLSAGAIRAGSAAAQERLGDPGAWLLALPGHHIAGLNVLIRAGLTGREPHVLDTARPFDAAGFAVATAALPSGSTYVSLVPTQLHRALADADGVAALRSYTAVLVGGAATGPALIDSARAAGVALMISYGMSETCGGCVYDGIPLRGVVVELASAGIGPVELAGPVVARGYRGLPDHPAFTVAADGARTFHTSDLGTFAADGSLTILGRADDMVITGGVKVSPLAVEHALGGAPGVFEVAVTAVPDAEWGQAVTAVVVPSAGGPPDLATLRAWVGAALGPAAAPRRLITVDTLPTRGPGKLDRVAIAEMAARRCASDGSEFAG